MPFFRKGSAKKVGQAISLAAVSGGGYFIYSQSRVPSSFVRTVDDDDTVDDATNGASNDHSNPTNILAASLAVANRSIPMQRAIAFVNAHGGEWEVQSSNITDAVVDLNTLKEKLQKRRESGKKGSDVGGVELELLKMKIPYVVQQDSEVYAAYNSDETAGDKRLFFSPVPHDKDHGVTTNVPGLRLLGYFPGLRPKQIAQHMTHRHLRRRWDKNYMAFDKAFADGEGSGDDNNSLQHPQFYQGIDEADATTAAGNPKAIAKNQSIVSLLRNLDVLQLVLAGKEQQERLKAAAAASEGESGEGKAPSSPSPPSSAHSRQIPLMVLPPSLRTPLSALGMLGHSKDNFDMNHSGPLLLGARRDFSPVYSSWARHCVGSAALEKVKLRPREFLYEFMVSHKPVVVGTSTKEDGRTSNSNKGSGGGLWGRSKTLNNKDVSSNTDKRQWRDLCDDDAYSIVYQSLPQCLLPTSTVRIPPAPVDVIMAAAGGGGLISGGGGASNGTKTPTSALTNALKERAAAAGHSSSLLSSPALLALAQSLGPIDSNGLMTTRMHAAGLLLSGMPKLPFRTAPVQMHYQEFIALPVWTAEDKQRYAAYVRSNGASIRQDFPPDFIRPPPADPLTGAVPPCNGTFILMTSCNDAQTPSAMPRWLEKSVTMSLSMGAYTMLLEGARSYEEEQRAKGQ